MRGQFVFPLIVVISCNLGYHFFSKSLPSSTNPFLGLSVTYITAFFITILLFVVTKNTIYSNQKANISIYNLLLGIVIIGVEGGYMLMYRTGWEVSKASTVANIVLAILLLLMGAIVFHENVDLKKIVGMILCVLGIALMK